MGNGIRDNHQGRSQLGLLTIGSMCITLALILSTVSPPAAARVAPELAEQLCTVIEHQITADGERIVFSSYQGDYTDRNQGGIYSIPTAGGTIEKINNAATDNSLNSNFLLSPDGSQSVYASADTIYAVPVAGGQSIELASNVASLDDVAFSADSQTIIYRADSDNDTNNELYAVPAQGGQTTAISNGGDISDFELAGDGASVIFLDRSGESTLYAAPISGGSVITLSDSAETAIKHISLSAAGNALVYVATVDDVETIVSINLDGSNHQQHTGSAGQQINQTAITNSGSHGLFIATSGGSSELYSIALSNGAVVRLNDELASGGSVVNMPIHVSPNGSFVVYLASQDSSAIELYQAPIEGGSTTKLNAPLVDGGNVGGNNNVIRISPDSRQVLYVADQEVDGKDELYGVALPTSTVTKLSPELDRNGRVTDIAGGDDGLLVTADSRFVIFAVRPSDSSAEIQLHSASLTSGWLVRLNDEPDPSGLAPVLTDAQLSADGQRVVYLDAYGASADTILRYSLRSETPTGGESTELIECTVGVSLANHMIVVDQSTLRDYEWTSRAAVANEVALNGHATYQRVGSRLLVSDPSASYSFSWPLLQLEQENETNGRGFIRFIDDEKLLLIDDSSLNNVSWPEFAVQSSAESEGRPNYHFVGDRILLLDGNGVKQFFWPGLQPDGIIATNGQPNIKFISGNRMLVNDASQLRYVSWPELQTLSSVATTGQSTLQFLSDDEVALIDNVSFQQLTWPELEPINTVATNGQPTYRFSSDHVFISDNTHLHVFDWPSFDNGKSIEVGNEPQVIFVANDTLLVTTNESVKTFSFPALVEQSSVATTGRAENRFSDDNTLLLADDEQFSVHSWPAMTQLSAIATDGIATARFSGADSLLLLDEDSVTHYDFPSLTERTSVATDGTADMQFITSDLLILQDADSITHYSWPAFEPLPTQIATVGTSRYERIADRLLVADQQSLRIFSYSELTLDLTLAASSTPVFRIVNNQLIVLDGSQLTMLDWDSLTQLDQKSTDGPSTVCIYAPIANCLETLDEFAPSFQTNDPSTGSALIGPAGGTSTMDRKPVFDWHAASDVAEITYEIQLNGVLDRGSAFSLVATVDHSVYVPTEPLENGSYSWTVRAIDAHGNRSEWQPMQQFSVLRFDNFVPIILK